MSSIKQSCHRQNCQACLHHIPKKYEHVMSPKMQSSAKLLPHSLQNVVGDHPGKQAGKSNRPFLKGGGWRRPHPMQGQTLQACICQPCCMHTLPHSRASKQDLPATCKPTPPLLLSERQFSCHFRLPQLPLLRHTISMCSIRREHNAVQMSCCLISLLLRRQE